MELTQALQEKIAEHMPGLVAGELKEFINKAQEQSRQLELTKTRLQTTEGQLRTAQDELAKHRDLDSKLADIAKREEELAGRELKLIHQSAENRAAVAEGKLDVLQGMMETVFRNTEIRRSVLERVPVPVDGMVGDPTRGIYPTPGHVQTHEKTSTVTEQNS